MATYPTGLPAPGTSPGFSQLDDPPPSPAVEQGMSPGVPLGSMVPPLETAQLPPEVLSGILQAGESIVESLDSFAAVLPQLGPDFAQAKAAVMAALAKVMQAGGGPTRPNAAGPGFPGGGFDRGGMPLASGGI